MDYRVIDLRTVETAGEGYLTFFEGEHDLPFPIRRIYYIHGTAQGRAARRPCPPRPSADAVLPLWVDPHQIGRWP